MPLYGTSSPPMPNPVAGQYIRLASTSGNTTTTLGNGSLRVFPVFLQRAQAFDRLGAEVTGAGEAGSTYRIGVYADNGNRYPGALILDAGTIDGTSATLQEITVSLTLSAGLYWFGGVTQNAPSSQPTLRAVASWTMPAITSIGTTSANTNDSFGQFQSGVAGALPSTFTSTVSLSGSTPRLFARTA